MISLALTFVLSASLTLKVTDAQNAAIPAARVVVYPQSGLSPLQRYTDAEGTVRIDVGGGSFVIQVDADGFQRMSRSVRVQEGGNVQEDFSLQVAGVNSSVVVTASDAPQTIDQTTKALTVVGSREILDRNEYGLIGILSSVPALQVRSVGSPGQASQLRVRGLRPDATSILIDGMRFRDAATTQGDASSFMSNLNFISADRVEVLRGSGSSLYGTNAAGGVVNIVTDEGGGITHGAIQAEGGALGFYRGRGQLGGGAFGERIKYSAGVMHMNVINGIDGDDRARSTGGQALVRYDFTSRSAASIRFFGSDDFTQVNSSPTATGIPVANIPSTVIVPASPLVTYFPGRNDPDNRRASRFHSTAFKLQHAFSPVVSLQASYQKVQTRRVFDNGPAGVGFQPMAINATRLVGSIDTVDARSSIAIAGWDQFLGGYEFEREGYDDLLDNNLPGSQRIRTETSIRQDAHAAYFQNQATFFGSRLQISLSGRAQVFGLGRPVFRAAGVSNTYERLRLEPPSKALTADASLSYFIGAWGTKLRTHFGNAYRAPALYERFGGGFSTIQDTGQLVFSPWGNPSLLPDRYNSADAGIDQYLWRDRVRISSTYFYTRVVTITAFDSGTVIKPATDAFGRTSGYINGSGGMSRGVELTVESRPTRSLTLSGSYTYTRAHLDRDITIPGFWRVLGVPRHAVTFVAIQKFGRRTTVAVDFVGNSEMFGNFTAAARPRAFRYPGFTKTDLSTTYLLRETEHGALKVNTRIDNIFNRTHYDLGWLAPRTTFVMGLGYQF
jgi:iron complex outermembrane receptor protein